MAKFVRPGGVFYIRDAHPIAWALDFERTDDDLVIALPYFEGEPLRYEPDVTYVEIDEKVQNEAIYEWNHGLGEIITALIDAGFRIDAQRGSFIPHDDEEMRTSLFDLTVDPHEANPIEDTEIESPMRAHMTRLMRENDAPAELYLRMGLETEATPVS